MQKLFLLLFPLLLLGFVACDKETEAEEQAEETAEMMDEQMEDMDRSMEAVSLNGNWVLIEKEIDGTSMQTPQTVFGFDGANVTISTPNDPELAPVTEAYTFDGSTLSYGENNYSVVSMSADTMILSQMRDGMETLNIYVKK